MSGPALTPPPATAPRAASSADRPPARPSSSASRGPGGTPAQRRRHVALALFGCLAAAALTLLTPSAPTYDPWAWIVWGREILHLDLSTVDGPSWKPLPVTLTTVFALSGSAAPTLWLLFARAGAFAGALCAFRLGRRLGGVPAGAAAAAGLLLAPWYVRNGALGNSEGLQVAFALAAIERHLAGDRRWALALGLGLGLLRPEAWPLLGLYGLWLVWRDRGSLVPVAFTLAALPLLWLVPERLGSGDWLRAAHRARQPVGTSPAFSDSPAREVLREGAAMLTPPVWAGLVLIAGFALWRRDRRIAGLVAGVLAWTGLVAVMTAHGYSGNQRYLIVPAALVIVLAGAGAGRALAALGARRGTTLAVAAVALAGAFALPSLRRLDDSVDRTSYQARLVDSLGGLVERAGGAAALRACGQAFTGPYLVPAVAWHLRVHTSAVGLHPRRPGVVFRVQTARRAPVVPSTAGLGPVRQVAAAPRWRVLTAC